VVASFLVHLIVYVAVNVLLVGIWALTNDADPEVFNRLGNGRLDGAEFVRDGEFWPIWPIMSWGAALFIHFGLLILTAPKRLAKKHKVLKQKWQEALVQQSESDESDDSCFGWTPGARKHAHKIEVAWGKPKEEPQPSRTSRWLGGKGREWVAVMLLDVADSTRLNEVLGDEAWSRLLLRLRAIVRAQVEHKKGAEVGTQGDSLLARFDNPADAVLCAVEIQRELSRHRQEGGIVPNVRIGVHAGEVVADDGDLVGRVLNLAARVSAEAEPDEILVTEPVADDVIGRVELEDRGLRVLRGLAQPRHVLSVVWQEQAPPPAVEHRTNGSKAPAPEPARHA